MRTGATTPSPSAHAGPDARGLEGVGGVKRGWEKVVVCRGDSPCPRLCRLFGLSAGYWLRAQAAYDIEVAVRELEPVLKKIAPWSGPAS